MQTRAERQRQRDEKWLEEEAGKSYSDVVARVRAARERLNGHTSNGAVAHNGVDANLRAMKEAAAAEQERRRRSGSKSKALTSEQVDRITRHLETVLEGNSFATVRVGSLIDMMHKRGDLPFEMWCAFNRLRELYWVAQGYSKGVSPYGEYQHPSPPETRTNVTVVQMDASEEFKTATIAMLGVQRQDGSWTVDEELLQVVIPAIFNDQKDVTQMMVGKVRCGYEGKAQAPAAGAAVLREAGHRLCLHFAYRQR